MKPIFRLAWARFNLIASIIGDVQGRVIATAFYFSILMPFGIASRLLSNPLRLGGFRRNQPLWLDRQPVPEDVNSAQLQG